jgi:hypothetical protein
MGLLNSNSLNNWLTQTLPQNARNLWGEIKQAPADLKGLFANPNNLAQLNQTLANSKWSSLDKDKAMSMAMDYLQTTNPVGGLLAHTVYHGSPHKFNKFDMSKIGTGEGAQAYGHGLYFAESPGVAMSYQDMLGKKVGAEHPSLKRLTDKQSLYVEKGGFDSVDDLRDAVASGDIGLLSPKQAEAFKKRQDQYVKTWDKVKQGNLYKVDIPDEAIPRMLDWDKPLSEQGETWKLLQEKFPYLGNQGHKTGEWALGEIGEGIGGLGPRLTQEMQQAGIPGIRYKDAMSRGTDAGTSNFVLFDDQLPRILEINGHPTGLLSYADEAKKAKKK